MDTSSTQTPKPTVPAPSRKIAKFILWRVVTWLGVALLAACTASPISKPLRTAAEHQPPFGALAARPEAFKGQTVLLGGSVVQTTNLPKMTEIEVLQKPLNRYDDSPEGGDRSNGRFLVRCPGFHDPAIYAKDRDITVAGPVEGQETRPLDQVQYTYPVIGCQDLHLWPILPAAGYYYPPPYGGFGPYWGGWYGYYPYYWYPYW